MVDNIYHDNIEQLSLCIKLDIFQVILGVDRLDYTKGLVARLKALEYMYTAYPYWIGKVTMLQVSIKNTFKVDCFEKLVNNNQHFSKITF